MIQLTPAPWRGDPQRAKAGGMLTVRQQDSSDSEGRLAFTLSQGERWCIPVQGLPQMSRLRLEAIRLSANPRTTLGVSWQSSALRQTMMEIQAPDVARLLSDDAGLDLPFPGTSGDLCLSAMHGSVALAEARILSPEPQGDRRPPWVVLVVGDALRADALQDSPVARAAPVLSRLARRGVNFTRAVAGGCHTRSSVWGLMSGRDMLRIDPLLRGGVNPRFAGAETIYSRGNLFVTEYARLEGYHSVFLGNNAFFNGWPAFQRLSLFGSSREGTERTIARLPSVLRRYGDERLVLVYYISATHSAAVVPQRLVSQLGCERVRPDDRPRCLYAAKVAHFDEALAALEEGLVRIGLGDRALRIITADHGENLIDSSGLEAEINGRGFWLPITHAHGASCYGDEINIPLLIVGDGLPALRRSERVSSLDIAPTILKAIGVQSRGLLDGRPLTLGPGPPAAAAAARSHVSYGFCSDSLVQDDKQLIVWLPDCGRRRRALDKQLVSGREDLWEDGRRRVEGESRRLSVESLRKGYWDWIQERIPSDIFMLEGDRATAAEISLTVVGGRISDFGPSQTVLGLDRIEVLGFVPPSELRLRIRSFSGRFFVATRPAHTPLRVRVRSLDPANGRPLAFVGPLQLPVAVDDVVFDPVKHRDFLFARSPASAGSLRLWWQAATLKADQPQRGAIEGFSRVLREWGYIR
jgi:hypothetical protein